MFMAFAHRFNSFFTVNMPLTPDAENSRFKTHVSFDNFAGAEATEKNTVSFTLNRKHKGYQFKRRSRTFMVGIDEHDYSNIALQWMLEELVDDGDEIICLRVIDKDSKMTSDSNIKRRQYQKEARETMERIQARNDDNKAISIVLEYAVGKLESTFQKMVWHHGFASSPRARNLLMVVRIDPALRTSNAHRRYQRP